MKLPKIPNSFLYFFIGVLIGGAIFYYAGYVNGIAATDTALAQCREKMALLNSALEKAVNDRSTVETEIAVMKTELYDLRQIVSTLRSALSNVVATGSADNVFVSAPKVVITNGRSFCFPVTVKNKTDFQKIVVLGASGMGVSGKSQPTSVGPGEELNIPLCGQIERDVAEAKLSVNGKEALSFYIMVSP